MAVIKSKDKKTTVYNPKYLLVTPWEADAEGVFAKGETVYMLQEVVRDSTSITQEDPEENPIDNEFSPDPIINNTDAGSYTFAANVGDMQKDLLAALAGFDTTTEGLAIAPDGYKEVFAEVALVFETAGKLVAAVLPKVQLNSKALLESINTSIGQISVAGTGYSGPVYAKGVAVEGKEAPFYMDYDYTLPTDGAGA